MRVKNYDKPNWRPLEKLIGSGCTEFMWMWRDGDVEFYKHIDTRRCLRLNNQGLCFREGPNGLEPANIEEELKRVFE